MTGLAIRFTAGRYHATPWGRHVNEGVPEWPPSPWRILRALVATWKQRLDRRLSQDEVRGLIAALLDPPHFVLPPASTGHSRHFMPWFKKGPGDRTLVFDTFVAVPKDADVFVLWPRADLAPEQVVTFELLADHLQFLGRAESWCEARVLDSAQAEALRAAANAWPANGTAGPGRGLVRVLCADADTALGNEAFSRPRTRGKRTRAAAGVRRVVTYDPDWHLCAETLWLHSERRADSPGSRWVSYERPKDCFRIAPSPGVVPSGQHRLQVARFALDSTVLPSVTETLLLAEAARRNLMGIFGRLHAEADGSRGRSEVFSGKDAEGRALVGHGHAFYLPTDEDGDGRLDHLTVVAEAGFGPREIMTLDRLREIKTAEREASGHAMRVLLLALDNLEDCLSGPAALSRIWRSATPFIVTRHLKKRGRKRDDPTLWADRTRFVAAVLREEVARLIERRTDLAGLSPEQVDIEPLPDGRCGARGLRPIQFRRFRSKGTDDGGRRPAGAFQLAFPVPFRGPIALGHSAHFGMGLFEQAPAR